MNAEIILLVACFLVILIAMILTIVLSTQTIARFSELGDSLEAALLSVFDNLSSITGSLIAQLTAFGRSVVSAFSSFAGQLGQGYLSINTFIQTEVTGLINYIGRQALKLADTIARLAIQSTLSYGSYVTQLIDAINFLVFQAELLIANTLASFSVMFIQVAAQGINFFIKYIGEAIEAAEELIEEAVKGISDLICDICCPIPGIGCPGCSC